MRPKLYFLSIVLALTLAGCHNHTQDPAPAPSVSATPPAADVSSVDLAIPLDSLWVPWVCTAYQCAIDTPDVPAPPDPPPSKIIVGPYAYKIYWRSSASMGNSYGITWTKTSSIYVDSGLSKGQLRETVLHELFHACQTVGSFYGNNSSADGFIESTAPTLIQILRDNPDLVRWLQEKP